MIPCGLGVLKTKAFWEPITRSLFLVATGADALAFYLEVTKQIASTGTLRLVHGAWLVLLVLWLATRPKGVYKDPTPARSGTAVVISIGLSATYFLAREATSTENLIVPAVVLLMTMIVAILVYRFASKHAAEIGEARFPRPHSSEST